MRQIIGILMLIGFFVGIILKTVHSEGIKEALIFWGQVLAFFLMQ